MHVRLWVRNLHGGNASSFENAAAGIDGVTAVDTWKGRAEMTVRDASAMTPLVAALRNAGFEVADDGAEEAAAPAAPRGDRHLVVEGMTCRSCEITIERNLKKVRGVAGVNADAGRGLVTITCHGECEPELRDLRRAIRDHGYVVKGYASAEEIAAKERPSFLRLIGLFGVVLVVSSLLSKFGLGGKGFEVGGRTGFFGAMLIGLVAGASSCIAVSGGLLLSTAAKFRERYGGGTQMERMRPVVLFTLGRVASYAFLGGVIGAVGRAFTPSPLVNGAITLFAAAVMIVLGLDMLKVAPQWLKGLLPRMPKSLSHRIMGAEGKEHWTAPFVLGAATFFLPCGFTQALQLYALTTGSFAAGATVLGGFALGTAPALLALGMASSSLKGKAGKLFLQFSGAAVVLIGLWNVQNGFTIAGHPLSLPDLGGATAAAQAPSGVALPPVVNGKQVIKMDVGGPGGAYDPDVLTVKAGIPVRWEVNGVNVRGCISVLQSRALGFTQLLQPGPNVIEFTPPAPGSYVFSCSMGMFRGTMNVVP